MEKERKRKEARRRVVTTEKRTIGKRRLDSETEKKLRIRSWNVCGFATGERKKPEILEQVSKRDLDIVRIRVMGERGGGNRAQSWRVRMDRVQ